MKHFPLLSRCVCRRTDEGLSHVSFHVEAVPAVRRGTARKQTEKKNCRPSVGERVKRSQKATRSQRPAEAARRRIKQQKTAEKAVHPARPELACLFVHCFVLSPLPPASFLRSLSPPFVSLSPLWVYYTPVNTVSGRLIGHCFRSKVVTEAAATEGATKGAATATAVTWDTCLVADNQSDATARDLNFVSRQERQDEVMAKEEQ